MREIGTIPEEGEARRLADYLLTLDITTRLDRRPVGWAVWVHKEDDLERARHELSEFAKNPADPRYEAAAQSAQALRKQAEQKEKAHRKNTIDLQDRWSDQRLRRRPLTLGLILGCVGIAFLSKFGRDLEPIHWLFLGEPNDPSGLTRVRAGEVWRLVTPIFIHLSIWHLLFNMLMLRDLGTQIEARRGPLRLAALVLVSAITSGLAQYEFTGNPFFGGMSGVVYALFGYVWMKRYADPVSGFSLGPNTVPTMLIWLVLCMTKEFQEFIGPVANTAHVVGLAVGIAWGLASHIVRNFRQGWDR